MNEEWTGEIISRLHLHGVSHKEFAKRCGYTPTYLSMVLNNKKVFSSDYSKRRTMKHIFDTMMILEHELNKRTRT